MPNYIYEQHQDRDTNYKVYIPGPNIYEELKLTANMKDGLTSLNGQPILDENENGKPITLYFLATEEYYGFFGPMAYPTFWTKALVVWFEEKISKSKMKPKVFSLWLRGDSRINLIKHMQSASYKNILVTRSLTVMKYGSKEKKLANDNQNVKVRPAVFDYKQPNPEEKEIIKEILAEIPERKNALDDLLQFNSENDLVIINNKTQSKVISEYAQKAVSNGESNGHYELPKLPVATLEPDF